MATRWATSIGDSRIILGTVASSSQLINLHAATSGTAVALTNSVFSGSGLSQFNATVTYDAAA